MQNEFFTEVYWAKAWNSDPNTSLKKMKRAGLGSYKSDGFKDWAIKFNETSFSNEGQKRTTRILSWIESQIGSFDGLSVLDVGAASGLFSIPFTKKGATVHALEPSSILRTMFQENAKDASVKIDLKNVSFEDYNEKQNGYDLVFASMCPAITDWKAVQKAIRLAEKYVYISLMAGAKTNAIVEELMPILEVEGQSTSSDMYYLLQLLYVNDYTYQSLIEKHTSTVIVPLSEVRTKLKTWFIDYNITLTDYQLDDAMRYLQEQYNDKVPVETGGKFGKVLIHK
ncbi:class I SAM-dependent methyltransferase [Bacillus sp. Marseille-P3800]|uniref:class I SAM-dependent methyltransferase n=1 Tax=Bacillus sp. Marseille-P3800 TaxID=2014782 RepID=UPI000C0835A7|nr:class I SAM-dependent methyltransferase [Bacillus sp. Marseille-P3800]